MSEYIEIETEISDDGRQLQVSTNLRLADSGPEQYASPEEMEEGSPVAQALAVVPGIAGLRMEESELVITRQPDADWHVIIADLSAALKDFFL